MEHGDTSVLQELASLLAADVQADLKYIAENCGHLVIVLAVLQS